MAKFITGKELEDVVRNIIKDANDILLIVSPYIKLGDYFKELFEGHLNNTGLELIVVFGKNEGHTSKSLSKDDFELFKKFPNVSVIYEPNLHAKYYGNEMSGVITSINLYDYSFKNNIEFGVHTEVGFFNGKSSAPERDAWDKCQEIAHNGTPVFIKRPIVQKGFLGSITGSKKYVASKILLDETEYFYAQKARKLTSSKKLADFPEELDKDTNNDTRPSPEAAKDSEKEMGYCIRTAARIPFNVLKPFSADAYKSWAEYGNKDYPEKYCHKTGRRSNGKTSMKHPVLEG